MPAVFRRGGLAHHHAGGIVERAIEIALPAVGRDDGVGEAAVGDEHGHGVGHAAHLHAHGDACSLHVGDIGQLAHLVERRVRNAQAVGAQHVVGLEVVVDDVADRRLDRRRDDTNAAHDCERHEQSGRRVRGAPLLARKVAHGQAAGDAEGMRGKPSEYGAEGPYKGGREHDDADHEQPGAHSQRPADADAVECRPGRGTCGGVGGMGDGEREPPAQAAKQRKHDAADGAPCDGRLRVRGLVHGLDRRGEGGAARGKRGAEQRDGDADGEGEQDDGHGGRGGGGERRALRGEYGHDGLDDAPAEHHADARSDEAEQQRLDDDGGEDLPRRDADGSQQRVSAHGVAHDHGEGVGDDERSDEQREHREDEDQRLDEAELLAV